MTHVSKYKPTKLTQAALACVVTLTACGGGSTNNGVVSSVAPTQTAVSEARKIPATPQAQCGPGSRPETGMQGRVSQADYDSGKAAMGFNCNTEVVGSYVEMSPFGTIGGYKTVRYKDNKGHECAYYDSTLVFPTDALDGDVGVVVLDMKDPTRPKKTTSLRTPAMLSAHESLVVSEEAGILAAVMGTPVTAPGFVDVYDLKEDCRFPVLLSSTPTGILGHESGISPDGKTFYSASSMARTLTAVDISNPRVSRILWTAVYRAHGITVSDDGNRVYMATNDKPVYLRILDTSEIQARKPNPKVKEIATLSWPTATIPQIALPFTKDGKPYLLEADEFAADEGGMSPAGNGIVVGASRIIDISDEKRPKVVSEIRLDVHRPQSRAEIANDPANSNGRGTGLVGGYAGHYCNIPTRVNPTIVACSMISSGLRIFDIRDVFNPVEVAYFHAPILPRPVPVPSQAIGFAMSSPTFAPERKEVWYTDIYNGFHAVKVTNGAWPD